MLFPLGTTWRSTDAARTHKDRQNIQEQTRVRMHAYSYIHTRHKTKLQHTCMHNNVCMHDTKDTKDTKRTMSVCVVHVYRNTFDDCKRVDLHRLEEGKNEKEKNRVSNNSKGMMYSYIK